MRLLFSIGCVLLVLPCMRADTTPLRGKKRVIDEILAASLADNVKARELMSDGSYRRVQPGPDQPRVRSQERFLELAAQQSARAIDVVPPPEVDPRTVSTRRPRKRQAN